MHFPASGAIFAFKILSTLKRRGLGKYLENSSKKELDIKILNKLDKSYYSDAVCIFYEAFEQKIRAFIKSKENENKNYN